MPVGLLDRRRGGHRCEFCIRGHRRCDGKQPCSHCRVRSLQCSLAPRETELQVITVVPEPQRALVRPPWRFVTICFESLGALPQSAVLCCDTVITLCQTDQHVNAVVVGFGKLFNSRQGGDRPEDTKLQDALLVTLAKHKEACLERMAGSAVGNEWSPTVLCGLLLLVIEFIIDQSGATWHTWASHVGSYIGRGLHARHVIPTFDRELIRFYQLAEITSSGTRAVQPLYSNYLTEALSKTREPATDWDRMVSALHEWASLQSRMVQWDRGTMAVGSLTVEQKVLGIELVCQAAALQSSLLGLMFDPSSPIHEAYQIPYYSWPIIGISQLLRRGSWKMLDCDLPTLPAYTLRKQAKVMLGDIERIAKQTGLGAAHFMPHAYFAGCEMKSKDERQRVIRFLEDPRVNKYALSGLLRQALRGYWDRLDSEDIDPSTESLPIR